MQIYALVRGGTDIENAHIGQHDKFSREYWILPISQLSPYWLLAIFIDTSDVAVLGHQKPIREWIFAQMREFQAQKTDNYRHFEEFTSSTIF